MDGVPAHIAELYRIPFGRFLAANGTAGAGEPDHTRGLRPHRSNRLLIARRPWTRYRVGPGRPPGQRVGPGPAGQRPGPVPAPDHRVNGGGAGRAQGPRRRARAGRPPGRRANGPPSRLEPVGRVTMQPVRRSTGKPAAARSGAGAPRPPIVNRPVATACPRPEQTSGSHATKTPEDRWRGEEPSCSLPAAPGCPTSNHL